MKVKEKNLLKTSIPKSLLTMALPMSIGILLVVLFYAVDAYYIGRLGEEYLAAVGYIFPVIIGIGHLAMGIGAGATTHLARLIGSDKIKKKHSPTSIKNAATTFLTLAILVGVFLTIIGYLTIGPLFKLIGATEKANLMPLIYDYMNIWYLGLVFVLVSSLCNSMMRGHGDVKTPAKLMLVATFLNLILDPFLIFGSYGIFPRLEMYGAALASVISYGITAILSFYIIYKRKYVNLRPVFKLKIKKFISLHLYHYKYVFYIGLPTCISYSLPSIASAFITANLSKINLDLVAAYAVAARMEAIFFVFFMGLAIATNIFVAQNSAALKYDRVKSALDNGFKFVLFFGLFSAGILIILGKYFASSFTTDFNIINNAYLYFLIVPISYACVGYSILVSSAMTGDNKPFHALSLAVIRQLILLFVFVKILLPIAGANGIFIAICLTNFTSAIISYFWIRRVVFRKNNLINDIAKEI